MLKKTAAFLLTVILLASAGAPALAAGESLNEKLEQVTLIVKETLGIDDRYTQFSGDLTEEGDYSYWELYWSSDAESLNVCADENGKVLRYYRYTDEEPVYDYYYGYAPVLPKTSADDALPAAQEFVEKVFGQAETASFNDFDFGHDTSDVDSYWFDGDVLLNGLKSPISFNVRVQASDMSVVRFYRSDCYTHYSGGVPSAAASVSADTASQLLAGTVRLRLQYVPDADGKTAVLRYLPVYTGDYIVDADTGELVDLNELYRDMYDGKNPAGMGAEAADTASSESGVGLSEVEQGTIAALEGVYSKDELDDAVRAMTELGIDDGYTLQSVSYTMNRETEEVQGQLSYIKEITDEDVLRDRFPEVYADMEFEGERHPVYSYKYITADAMTGALETIYTYTNTGYEEKSVLDTEGLRENAGAFLEKYFPDTYAAASVNEDDSSPDDGSFIYSHTVNGILFPTNSAYISVNAYDGTIDSFSISWTDDVRFDSSDGLVSAADAMAAYIGCYETLLQYVQAPLEEDTLTYSYELKLAYQYDCEYSVIGVDAKTGEAIVNDTGETAAPRAYDDLAGCYGKQQIETLAEYGIGFPGASFKPTAKLTQKDALFLFLSAVGYSSEDEEDIYRMAYNYNFLTEDEKDPDKLLSRAQLIKMLIGATEYAPAAELTDIFDCGFNDDYRIPAEYYGYVAIAKGLGIVRGDLKGNFNPDNIVTCQDAAIILYNFMLR